MVVSSFARRSLALTPLFPCALALLFVTGCGGDDEKGGNLGTGGTAVIGVGGSSPIPIGTGGSGAGKAGGSGGSGAGPYMLPPDFTKANNGGYKLGDPVPANGSGGTSGSGGSSSSGGCGAEILGIVRDFKSGKGASGHPDFETFTGDGEQGIVQSTLGTDLKPVYVAGEHEFTTTKANFDQWYRTEAGVSDAYFVSFYLQPGNGVLTFFSNAFFPLDGEGFGNEGNNHNFHFTTEVHTTFQYNGGETFAFTGDDDLWVFINKRLAIDLGGLHSSQTDQVSLDGEATRLGITRGNIYALDLFHAERHTDKSNFRIDTNLAFVDCGIIVPDEPVR